MWDADVSAATGAAAQVATAVVAVAAAVFARGQVREARRTREAQAQPFVVVDVVPGRVWMNWLTLVVENVGATLAKDVVIRFDPPLETSVADNRVGESVLLTDGIAVLPPGRRIETLFDLSHDRIEKSLPMRYRVSVSFKDHRGRQQESLPYDIDLSYLYDLEMPSEKSLHDLVKEVAELRREIGHWRDGERGLLIRRPADVRRARADERWQFALTGTRRSLAHPGVSPGWAWPARLPLLREWLYDRRLRQRRR